jgi:3-hydroxyisobutyrate dehydrogenase-like beta-hydroxyacid dehydrogenase
MPKQHQHDVAVLGCGNMGSAIARTALAAGHRTVIWNRTPARALPLRDVGAAVATSAGDAIASAELTIVCVSSTREVERLLRSAESALAGATVLNLTSGTLDDAARLAAWATANDLSYLDGAILAYPEQIGSPEARIVVAGEEALWLRHRDVILDLAGASTYAGGDPGAANVVDTGITGVFYFSSVVAFIEAVRYLQAAGVPGDAVADLIGHATAQLDWQLRDILRRTVSGDYGTDQATLAVYHESGEAFLDAVRAKVAAPLLTTTVELLTQAMSAGLGDRDISALTTLSDSPDLP